ncbi:FecR family protein [Sinomicrobium sp.]
MSYLLRRFFSNEITDEEMLKLDRLLKTDKVSKKEFETYVRLHHKLSGLSYTPKGNKRRAALFQSIMKKIRSGEGRVIELRGDIDGFREEGVAPDDGTGDTKLGQYRAVRRRRMKVLYGLAACLVVALGLRFFDYTAQMPPSVEKYSNLKGNVQPTYREKSVQLVVDGEEIAIEEEAPVISYSESGERIDINERKAVHQEVEGESDYNTVIVPYGKRSTVRLADGTRVWLNAGSTLMYPSRFSKNRREVYLEGQAIFDVSHDAKKPFYVLSPDQVVKVLGTVFDVRAYPKENFSRTVLKTGSVEVDYPKASKNVRIKPNTLVMLDKGSEEVTRMDVDAETYMTWRKGIFVFENENVKEISKVLSDYYGVEIELDGDFQNVTTYSGRLNMQPSVEDVLDLIKDPLYFSYEREGGKILLTN